ncbi:acyl carrier protein [Roseovarius faecimaris]|uniref:Acyl carrier protein n=1 Tax=Roseovarius faecimaris TaxID=2494550 RepID=A0A6I6IWM4_9RHOB|nr:phosphopantetheine-binding protein [Roseovarius faecimaris]QGX99837.1 acyl carrier protein [Roseovarius faecimaris]
MTANTIEETVISTLEAFIQDWGLDAEITPETTIVEDLEFDSIDVIQFTVELDKAFGNRKIGFQELLMKDGRYVDDLSVAEFASFLQGKLATA